MRTFTAILMAAALTVASAAQAKPVDTGGSYVGGDDLWDWCGKSATTQAPERCVGYILGVVDLMSTDDIFTSRFCLPTHTTSGQITDTVRRYLRDNPDTLQYSAASDVAVAIFKAYPCS
jgi:hypothetical protein